MQYQDEACSGANASDGTNTMRPWGFDGLALEQLNSEANASDGTNTMRPWGFDGLALEQLNNPVTSVERIPHNIADDAAVAEWMNAFVAAAAADDTKMTCAHQRWTKEGGGAFNVELVDTSCEAAVIWQVEE